MNQFKNKSASCPKKKKKKPVSQARKDIISTFFQHFLLKVDFNEMIKVGSGIQRQYQLVVPKV
jgi:hypothetical protein